MQTQVTEIEGIGDGFHEKINPSFSRKIKFLSGSGFLGRGAVGFGVGSVLHGKGLNHTYIFVLRALNTQHQKLLPSISRCFWSEVVGGEVL